MPKRSESGEVELDYSPSSGAVGSDKKNFDIDAPIEHDGRSGTHTTFNPEEGDDKAHWEQLRKEHEGNNSLSGTRRRKIDRRRDAITWCSQLEFSDQQTRRVLYLVDHFSPTEEDPSTDVDLGENTEQSVSNEPTSRQTDITFNDLGSLKAETGILTIIAHVANENNRPVIHPLILTNGIEYPESSAFRSPIFREICDVCKVTVSGISSAYDTLLPEIERIE